jgi:alpha,alpha-trehalase
VKRRIKNLAGLALALSVLALAPEAPVRRAGDGLPPPQPPSQLFPGLYERVAQEGIFSDFKAFADAIPNEAPADILAEYQKEKPKDDVALSLFVRRHFTMDTHVDVVLPLPRQGLAVGDHIAALWPLLTRTTQTVPLYSSALPLPEPYVVPGGRFQEIYYWDSYFTMLGLGPRESSLRDGMIANFAYMIRTFGHIPNGSRTYYLSRSQPPFFFKMVALSNMSDEPAAFAHFLPELKAEYAFWMTGERTVTVGTPTRNAVKLPDGAILNRNWDDRETPRDEEFPKDLALAKISKEPKEQLFRNVRAAAESGWDFSSRWFADNHSLPTIETTDIIPVDLNSLLYGLERAIQSGCGRAGDSACAKEFDNRATRRRAAMNRYLWDAKAGAFFDYDWRTGVRRNVLSAATLYPLFVGEANDAQAQAVATITEARLVKPGGLATTENHTGQQWDAPNGWAPLQWVAVEGLLSYDQTHAADAVATRWLRTVLNAYAASGRLLEKYNVDHPEMKGGGGEYPLQDGFGWTNGVTVALLHRCPLVHDGVAERQCVVSPQVK